MEEQRLKKQVAQGLSLRNIGDRNGYSRWTAKRRLKKYGMQTKKIRRYFYGKDHPNYKHGKSGWKRSTNPKKQSVIK